MSIEINKTENITKNRKQKSETVANAASSSKMKEGVLSESSEVRLNSLKDFQHSSPASTIPRHANRKAGEHQAPIQPYRPLGGAGPVNLVPS